MEQSRGLEFQTRTAERKDHPETTGRMIKTEAVKSVKSLGRGITHVFRGIIELTTGAVKGIDTTALSLGAFAIMTIGAVTSPIPANFSREKNIIDINKRVFALAQAPKYARLAGYPLLALAGGYGVFQIKNALAK